MGNYINRSPKDNIHLQFYYVYLNTSKQTAFDQATIRKAPVPNWSLSLSAPVSSHTTSDFQLPLQLGHVTMMTCEDDAMR